MDELQLVRELGDETPLPDQASLAPARAAFLAGIAERGPVRLRRRRSRYTLVGASVVGLAAAVAAAITLIPVGQPAPGGQAQSSEVTDAVKLLNFAAQAARAEPEIVPRPDQFVYTRTVGSGPGGSELWLSVDGTRDGVIRNTTETGEHSIPLPGCVDGRQVVVKGDEVLPGVFDTCEPTPAYPADAPTDVDGMLAYLDRIAGEGASVNVRGKTVMHLISDAYMRPAARAALWEAAARIPGLSVVPDTRDGSGRAGTGVTWPVPEGSKPEAKPQVLVFDPVTYEYLGTDTSAVLQLAIVDQVGQRP
jgi:hypothetical protein